MLYDYTNKENDIVRNAFRTGNWDSIRNLPNDLRPFAVQQHVSRRLQEDEIHSQMVSQNKRVFKELLKDHGGLFMRFEYVGDPYEEEKRVDEARRRMGRAAMISEQAFNPASNKRILKYQYPFLAENEVSMYTFLSMNDPYEATKDEKLRALWIEECKKLFGPFRPAGLVKPLSTVSKSQLREIVESLKRVLLSDWNDVNFVIGSKSLIF